MLFNFVFATCVRTIIVQACVANCLHFSFSNIVLGIEVLGKSNFRLLCSKLFSCVLLFISHMLFRNLIFSFVVHVCSDCLSKVVSTLVQGICLQKQSKIWFNLLFWLCFNVLFKFVFNTCVRTICFKHILCFEFS